MDSLGFSVQHDLWTIYLEKSRVTLMFCVVFLSKAFWELPDFNISKMAAHMNELQFLKWLHNTDYTVSCHKQKGGRVRPVIFGALCCSLVVNHAFWSKRNIWRPVPREYGGSSTHRHSEGAWHHSHLDHWWPAPVTGDHMSFQLQVCPWTGPARHGSPDLFWWVCWIHQRRKKQGWNFSSLVKQLFFLMFKSVHAIYIVFC